MGWSVETGLGLKGSMPLLLSSAYLEGYIPPLGPVQVPPSKGAASLFSQCS